MLAILLKTVKKLEPTYREVVTMRYLEELTPREIARILEITPTAVSVRITRGIEKLKEIYNNEKNI